MIGQAAQGRMTREDSNESALAVEQASVNSCRMGSNPKVGPSDSVATDSNRARPSRGNLVRSSEPGARPGPACSRQAKADSNESASAVPPGRREFPAFNRRKGMKCNHHDAPKVGKSKKCLVCHLISIPSSPKPMGSKEANKHRSWIVVGQAI